MNRIIPILISLLISTTLSAAQWQWSVEVEHVNSNETTDPARAFLWIPEDCEQVRGIVFGVHNMLEEGILEHPRFREEMRRLGFAEIWLTPPFDMLFNPDNGAQEAFDDMIHKLAEASGYTELKYAPIVPVGHSACASFPWNFAALNPERTLAILSIKGDSPRTHLTGCGRPNLDWGTRTVEGIPGLIVMGEYEWWEDRLFSAFAYRKQFPDAPISLLADAGRGHFDYSDNLVGYLALFVAKAARYRLPTHSSPTPSTQPQPLALLPVKASQGWLADRWHKDAPPKAPAAPYARYTGNKEEAFWYFDREMAEATEQYYTLARSKKSQYLAFLQDGRLLPYYPDLHFGYNLPFHPQDDGLTFHLSAAYVDSLRTKKADTHAATKINITRICGPVVKVNDTTFTVRFYRMGLNNTKRTSDIWLMASNDGDEHYKSTVQQLNIRIPHRNSEGSKQTITFPQPQDISANVSSVTLTATSDSSLPVYYYVKEGPAEVEGNNLMITKIPPKAKYPVKVTVVAWQYGRATEPKVQTAEAVERTFYIK